MQLQLPILLRSPSFSTTPAKVSSMAFSDPIQAKIGILGQVSNHFGVIETNGRGMLHSHALVWFAGNLDFATLRQRILHDNDFAQRIIRYLESIIVHSIDSLIHDNAEVGPADLPPSSKDQESDDDFYMRLKTDSNAVAQKIQMHSSKHNATCF